MATRVESIAISPRLIGNVKFDGDGRRPIEPKALPDACRQRVEVFVGSDPKPDKVGAAFSGCQGIEVDLFGTGVYRGAGE